MAAPLDEAPENRQVMTEYRTKSVAKFRDGNNVWHHGSRTTGKILK